MTKGDTELPPMVVDALTRGRKIEAIKLLRKARGIGLKEAKEALDAYSPNEPPVSGSVVSGGGSRLPWLVVAILLALLVTWQLGGF